MNRSRTTSAQLHPTSGSKHDKVLSTTRPPPGAATAVRMSISAYKKYFTFFRLFAKRIEYKPKWGLNITREKN
ncbi:hypothetical protein ACMX25_24405 [Caballeronia sp. 15715]|uniref:hypothetical protein n=1 Tax=Caballeronia sp. 15715 TaxID=3391030 RepID=UPI0039E3C653